MLANRKINKKVRDFFLFSSLHRLSRLYVQWVSILFHMLYETCYVTETLVLLPQTGKELANDAISIIPLYQMVIFSILILEI